MAIYSIITFSGQTATTASFSLESGYFVLEGNDTADCEWSLQRLSGDGSTWLGAGLGAEVDSGNISFGQTPLLLPAGLYRIALTQGTPLGTYLSVRRCQP